VHSLQCNPRRLLSKEKFDAFLECGILAHGFLRLRCPDCAQEKFVACEASIPGFLAPKALLPAAPAWAGNVHVAPTPAAFSCKRRGFCPACGARRMAETVAHLVDYVIPRVPVRQWVLSFPIPLRFLFASKPHLLAPVLQVIHRVI
jgi:hypothetical protein